MHYYYGIIGPQNHNGDGLLGSNSIIVVIGTLKGVGRRGVGDYTS